MRILSMSEFANYCGIKRPSYYIYATENQPASSVVYVRMVLKFNTVKTMLHPNVICFANEHDKMCLFDVQDIQVFDEKPCVGTVFRIRFKGGDRPDSVWIMD